MTVLLRFVATFFMTSSLFAFSAPAADIHFTLTSPARVPGVTLQPGDYSLHIINQLSDRSILRVDAKDGGTRATFLGIANTKAGHLAERGIVNWGAPSDGAEAIRGFYRSGTPALIEFVYPKTEAVALAQSNHETVPAVDPASEGKVADSTLSQQDMQLLTLWLLTPQTVGADGKPGITAARYQTASLQKPVIKSLPHTASGLPWLLFAGLASLAAAALFRFLRSPEVTNLKA